MRYSWTIEALEQVYAQGLAPAHVHYALAGPGPRLIQPVNGETCRIMTRDRAGRLIKVWLRESQQDGQYDVWTAFEAGAMGQAQWKNAFGDGER